MSDLTDKIRAAQRSAAENAVIADLSAKGFACAAGVDPCPCAVATLLCADEEAEKLRAALAEVASLRAELAEARSDKERLDHVDATGLCVGKAPSGIWLTFTHSDEPVELTRGDSVREALDAARKP